MSVRAGPINNNTAITTAIRPSERPMSVNVLAGRVGCTTSMARAGSPAGASPDKSGHLVEQRRAFVSSVVEVRRGAYAAARAIVDDEASLNELLVHVLGVAGVDGHVPAARLRVVRRAHGEAALERAFE